MWWFKIHLRFEHFTKNRGSTSLLVFKFYSMRRFTLLLIWVLGIVYAPHLQAQCTGNLSRVLTGSSTGGNVSAVITTPPNNTTIVLGSPFTLSVVASGDNLTYQWRKGNTNISGATLKDYTVASATSNDVGNYTVVITGTCGNPATSNTVTVSLGTVAVSIKVFLEGPYTSSGMNASLGAYIPTSNGSQSTTSAVISSYAIVDWVTIELRSSSNPSTIQYSKNALLKSTGDVVDVDGVSTVSFTTAQAGNYYVAVRHRNHLGFRSNSTIALSSSTPVINFTNGSVVTYGTNALKYKLSAYMMYAGDANGDGTIDADDKNLVWLLQNGIVGYKSGDFNMDTSVDSDDKNLYWLLNNSIIQQL